LARNLAKASVAAQLCERYGNRRAAELLLESGANPLAIDAMGNIALHAAAAHTPNVAIVKLLALRPDVLEFVKAAASRQHRVSSDEAPSTVVDVLHRIVSAYRQRARLMVLCYRAIESNGAGAQASLPSVVVEYCERRYHELVDSIDVCDSDLNILRLAAT
jgi:ankyrin repeat protein